MLEKEQFELLDTSSSSKHSMRAVRDLLVSEHSVGTIVIGASLSGARHDTVKGISSVTNIQTTTFFMHIILPLAGVLGFQ